MLEIEVAMMTHVGKVRRQNEDSICYVRPSTTTLLATHGVLALVADGMGGHNAGERASSLATETIARAYFDSIAPPREALLDAINLANAEIYREARADRRCRGMGSTCVAVAVCGDRAWWAWVGDSRLYLIRGGTAYLLTQDHTVVQDMVQRGWMTREEASTHRDRNVLDRALGVSEDLEAGLSESGLKLQGGDCLLLCSDGLHGLISDEEVAGIVSSSTLSASAQALIDSALARGAPDNVSVLLLQADTRSAPPVLGPASENRDPSH